jgi:phosphate transport system permease protein
VRRPPEFAQQPLEYFLLDGLDPSGDEETPRAEFSSLENALADLRERQGRFQGDDDAFSAAPIEIVVDRPDATPRRGGRAAYEYHVGIQGGVKGGDGSELSPLPDLAAAAELIRQRHGDKSRQLRPGQRIRLVWREVFTATRFEARKKLRESVAKYIFLAMTVILVLPVIGILGFLFLKAWPVLSPNFIFENPKDYMTAGGIWAPLVGTFFLVLISLSVAAPIGILGGVYLNEYAGNNWFTRIINLAVVNLAGVPSIVHGLFGVGAFVMFAGMGKSMMAASCTLAVMSLPVIITSTREALAAVPMSFRHACWNMGATRWQTIRTIVLPNSISGILTGVIFTVTRAAGETAPILFTGAVFFVKVPDSGLGYFVPYGLDDRCMALSYHLFTLATQVRGVSEEVQYGTAVVLIGLVLLVNSFSIALRVYLRSRKKW